MEIHFWNFYKKKHIKIVIFTVTKLLASLRSFGFSIKRQKSTIMERLIKIKMRRKFFDILLPKNPRKNIKTRLWSVLSSPAAVNFLLLH